MRDRFERLLSAALVVSAVALAVSVAHREFAPTKLRAAATPSEAPTFTANWKEVLPVGIRVGDSTAGITVVEFADLECPFCRGFQSVIHTVMRNHPKDVSLIFVHFPLESHRFARQAAQAAECADSLGRFAELVDLVYGKQDSIGMKSWGSYAQDAGIQDTASFSRCARKTLIAKRIDAGRSLADKLHVNGTPTVFVNGWRYNRSPGSDELEQTVRTLLKGGLPGDTTKSGANR